jgi:pimeloyl-ACP methyl ester carboxylesterase
MPLLQREQATVAYDAAGPTGGRAVVLLHNIFCDRQVFASTAAALADRARTLNIDLRGHGQSPLPARPYTIADLVEDVRAVLDQQGIARADLVGLSIGATVAAEFALAYPQRTGRVVLMGADGEADGGLAALRNAAFRVLVRVLGMRLFILATVAKTLFGASFRRDGGDRYRQLHAGLRAFGSRAAGWAMGAWTGRRPLLAALATLDRPTLVVVGDEDVSCPLPCGQKLVRVLPQARLVRVPAAGHTLPAEQPGPTTALVREFLGL